MKIPFEAKCYVNDHWGIKFAYVMAEIHRAISAVFTLLKSSSFMPSNSVNRTTFRKKYNS